jgi:sugar phosphate isomerase/epimerase
MPYVLTAYGLPHVMGYLKTRDGQSHPSPIGPVGLMDAAVEMGLAGVEIPLPAGTDGGALRAALRERNLHIVPNSLMIGRGSVAEFRASLEAAAALGAKVVRSTLSTILCGDRRSLTGGWPAYFDGLVKGLNEVLPIADDLGMCIALENHQDATSDDLLRLADATGNRPSCGVCLDAGNPLAVGEGPVEFARRIAHLIRHVHLKDYTIHFAPEGYRLVRCAAGDGVVDFPTILEIVRSNGHDVLPGIEIGAQATRTIPLLEDSWWSCYPERHPQYLVEALRVLWAKGRPQDEPYSSAWERGEDSATVAAEEWDIVRRSASYFRGLEGGA